MTTDFGSESGLNRKRFELRTICPHAAPQLRFLAEDDDSGDDVDQSVFFDLTSSLHVPGSLHIIHNLAKDVTNSMPNFDEQKTGMKAMSSFMKDKHNREAWQATCFASGEAALGVSGTQPWRRCTRS